MLISVKDDISENFIGAVPGPEIPCVEILGKTSGRIYLFSLKAILPSIQIWNLKK